MVMPGLSVPWGPTGEIVYNRTYRRIRDDGSSETWPDTVRRVVAGNIALVDQSQVEHDEGEKLTSLLLDLAVLPAGRHLWMSGALGNKQFLFNCHVAGWDPLEPAAHFRFTFDQLMQGGGVGANYSNRYLDLLPAVADAPEMGIVCGQGHPNFDEMSTLLTNEFLGRADNVTVEDSREGWFGALDLLLGAFLPGPQTERPRSPLVFDMSQVRPRGRRIRTFGGVASGPAPLARMLRAVADLLRSRVGQQLTSLDAMRIDHLIAEAVSSGNVRRSARMSIKAWSDPDIFAFLAAKSSDHDHWTTNLSVEIDGDFLQEAAMERGHATDVLDAVVAGMLLNGEPGLWNHERAQDGEPREVVATNPCGEIALEPWENCNLGHVNLERFVDDPEGAIEAHRLMCRFLMRATKARVIDDRQRAAMERNRRIGVGHLGFQGWLVRRGLQYSTSHQDEAVRHDLMRFHEAVRSEAISYAAVLGIPVPVKVTTVAPTGTVAKLAGSTEGMQPIYGRHYLRRIRFPLGDPELERLSSAGHTIEPDAVDPYGAVAVIPTKDALFADLELTIGTAAAEVLVESADEIDLKDFLAVQAMYQECYADNAVSATANLRPDTYTAAEIRALLLHAMPRLKGTTVMVDSTRAQAPYERITPEEYAASPTHELGSDSAECVGDVCPLGNETDVWMS